VTPIDKESQVEEMPHDVHQTTVKSHQTTQALEVN
jgi:hypothetical protein